MLSHRWVWVLRALWLISVVAVLWGFYLIRDFFVTDPATIFGSLGRASAWGGMILLFLVLLPMLCLPEILPDFLFHTEKAPTRLRLSIDGPQLIYLVAILMFVYIISIPVDGSIGPNRPQATFLLAAVGAGAGMVLLLASMIRRWPGTITFVLDEKGLMSHTAADAYDAISYEEIKEIVVAEREVFRPCSLLIRGKVVGRTINIFSAGGSKETRKEWLRVERLKYRGFKTSEILERILAHCDDSVKVEYVKKIPWR